MVAQVGTEILGVLLEVLLCNRGYVISFCRKMRVMELAGSEIYIGFAEMGRVLFEGHDVRYWWFS